MGTVVLALTLLQIPHVHSKSSRVNSGPQLRCKDIDGTLYRFTFEPIGKARFRKSDNDRDSVPAYAIKYTKKYDNRISCTFLTDQEFDSRCLSELVRSQSGEYVFYVADGKCVKLQESELRHYKGIRIGFEAKMKNEQRTYRLVNVDEEKYSDQIIHEYMPNTMTVSKVYCYKTLHTVVKNQCVDILDVENGIFAVRSATIIKSIGDDYTGQTAYVLEAVSEKHLKDTQGETVLFINKDDDTNCKISHTLQSGRCTNHKFIGTKHEVGVFHYRGSDYFALRSRTEEQQASNYFTYLDESLKKLVEECSAGDMILKDDSCVKVSFEELIPAKFYNKDGQVVQENIESYRPISSLCLKNGGKLKDNGCYSTGNFKTTSKRVQWIDFKSSPTAQTKKQLMVVSEASQQLAFIPIEFEGINGCSNEQIFENSKCISITRMHQKEVKVYMDGKILDQSLKTPKQNDFYSELKAKCPALEFMSSDLSCKPMTELLKIDRAAEWVKFSANGCSSNNDMKLRLTDPLVKTTGAADQPIVEHYIPLQLEKLVTQCIAGTQILSSNDNGDDLKCITLTKYRSERVKVFYESREILQNIQSNVALDCYIPDNSACPKGRVLVNEQEGLCIDEGEFIRIKGKRFMWRNEQGKGKVLAFAGPAEAPGLVSLIPKSMARLAQCTLEMPVLEEDGQCGPKSMKLPIIIIVVSASVLGFIGISLAIFACVKVISSRQEKHLLRNTNIYCS